MKLPKLNISRWNIEINKKQLRLGLLFFLGWFTQYLYYCLFLYTPKTSDYPTNNYGLLVTIIFGFVQAIVEIPLVYIISKRLQSNYLLLANVAIIILIISTLLINENDYFVFIVSIVAIYNSILFIWVLSYYVNTYNESFFPFWGTNYLLGILGSAGTQIFPKSFLTNIGFQELMIFNIGLLIVWNILWYYSSKDIFEIKSKIQSLGKDLRFLEIINDKSTILLYLSAILSGGIFNFYFYYYLSRFQNPNPILKAKDFFGINPSTYVFALGTLFGLIKVINWQKKNTVTYKQIKTYYLTFNLIAIGIFIFVISLNNKISDYPEIPIYLSIFCLNALNFIPIFIGFKKVGKQVLLWFAFHAFFTLLGTIFVSILVLEIKEIDLIKIILFGITSNFVIWLFMDKNLLKRIK